MANSLLSSLSRLSLAHLFYPMREAERRLAQQSARIAELENRVAELQTLLITERQQANVEQREILDRFMGLPPGREEADPPYLETEEDEQQRLAPLARIRERDTRERNEKIRLTVEDYLKRKAQTGEEVAI